ncbi:unnamed protein product [Strongylus vulgaris]|uniref:Uncharacterized protein n=1 Tax=Strongylus vulgaris TaxID=40348 RepID=A0A3P7IX20_STRVU|nr:unnamed protein product [Strongylus vulgaris]
MSCITLELFQLLRKAERVCDRFISVAISARLLRREHSAHNAGLGVQRLAEVYAGVGARTVAIYAQQLSTSVII